MGEDERGEREKEREVIGAQCTVQRNGTGYKKNQSWKASHGTDSREIRRVHFIP